MSGEFVLREINGDLFAAPKEYALGHCVAADLRMGAGIAVKFRWIHISFFVIFICIELGFFCRDTFKQVQQLKDQKVQTGGVAVIQHQSRFIYYLVTKSSTYQKPTYRDLFSSLHAMKDHMVIIHFAVAIPSAHIDQILMHIDLSHPRTDCKRRSQIGHSTYRLRLGWSCMG